MRLIFLIYTDKLFSQIIIGFDRHTTTINHCKYINDAIKNNKVKSRTYATTIYDNNGAIIDTIKYISYFDSSGKKTNEIYYDNKGKISTIEENFYNLDHVIPIKNQKHTNRIYCITKDTINLINLKILKQFKIDSIIIMNDTSIRSYSVLKRKIVLIDDILSDSYGNNLRIIEYNSDKKEKSIISYEYDYTMKSFKSYTFINKVKYLVSVGLLNNNNLIIKENYYWIKYNSIIDKNMNEIIPEQTFIYSIDDNNLLNSRIHTFVVDGFDIQNNPESMKLTPKENYQKAISKINYEYYYYKK